MRRARPSPERSIQSSQKASRLSIPQSRGWPRARSPKAQTQKPKPEARSAPMLYCLSHGTSLPLRFPVGLNSPGRPHHPFHPPPPRLVLASHHPHRRMDRRSRLHPHRSHPRRQPTQHFLPGFSPPPPHPRTRTRHPRQSLRRQLRRTRSALSRRRRLLPRPRRLRQGHRLPLRLTRCLLPPRRRRSRPRRFPHRSSRPRTRPRVRPQLRFSSRQRPACPRLRSNRPARKSRTALPTGHENLYHFRNLLQLRSLPSIPGTHCRSPRLGPENSRPTPHHARLPKPPRTPLVPQSPTPAGPPPRPRLNEILIPIKKGCLISRAFCAREMAVLGSILGS